jgi:hypothetical protein
MSSNFEIVWKEGELEKILAKGEWAYQRAMDKVAMVFIGALSEAAPVDTGQLAAEGNWKAVPHGKYGRMIYSLKNYAAAVYYGSKPHAVPFGALSLWASRHNVPAMAVWYKIYHHGVDPNPFVDRATVKVSNQPFNIYMSEAMQEVGA